MHSARRIEVRQGDILRLTLIAEEFAYSFAIDEYRIEKRVAPGRNGNVRVLR